MPFTPFRKTNLYLLSYRYIVFQPLYAHPSFTLTCEGGAVTIPILQMGELRLSQLCNTSSPLPQLESTSSGDWITSICHIPGPTQPDLVDTEQTGRGGQEGRWETGGRVPRLPAARPLLCRAAWWTRET